MEKLNYLKIHPRDQEENKLLILRGDRLYEEATGPLRQQLGELLSDFEAILDRQDKGAIRQAAEEIKEELDEIEAAMQSLD